MNEIISSFAHIIYNARTHRGMSQRELGKKTGMKAPNICEIESGKVNITLKTIDKILRALKYVVQIRSYPNSQ